jgi:hypothetical protein
VRVHASSQLEALAHRVPAFSGGHESLISDVVSLDQLSSFAPISAL